MSRRRRPLPRPALASSRALVAFFVIAVLALAASVILLWPDAAAKIVVGLAQAPHHLEQWLPAGLFD